MKKLHPNLIKIIRRLNDGEYHSGDELGKTLGVTRSAVWKAIKKLQQYGALIHSVQGKGYALAEPLLLLDKLHIKKQLKLLNPTVVDIKIFASLTSTNAYLQTHPEPADKIKICLAETQTHGRGRFKRCWHSPFGQNIYFSCRYAFQKDIGELTGLSLVTSLAILKTMREFGIHSHLSVQWPNYIVWRQQKLACCLIEIQAETNGSCDAIIGIGINVNQLTADQDFLWASMRQALGKYIDRNVVCAALTHSLIEYLRQFEQRGFFPFKKEWLANDGLIKQAISISHQEERIHGQALGINDHGHLLLQTADQGILTYSTGDSALLISK